MSMFAGDLSSKYLRQGYGMPTSSLRNQPTQAGMGVSSTIKQPLRNTGGRGLPNLRETSAYKQGLTRNIDQNMGGYVNPSLFSDPNLGRSQGRDQGPIGTGVPASDVPAFNPKYNSGIAGGIVSRAQLGTVRTASDGPAFDPHKANMELGQGGRKKFTTQAVPVANPNLGQPNPYQANVNWMNQMAQKNAQVGSDGSSIFPTFSYDPNTNQYMQDSSAFGLTGDAANTYYSPEDFQSEFGRTLGKMPSPGGMDSYLTGSMGQLANRKFTMMPQGGSDQGPIGTGVPASDVPAFDPSYNSGITGGMQLGQTGQDVPPTGIANDPVLTGSADDLSNPYYYNSGIAGGVQQYGGSYSDPSLGQTGIANDPVLTNGSGYFDTSGGANTYGQTPTGQAGGGLNYSGMSPSTGGLDTGMGLLGLGGLFTGGSLQDILGSFGQYYGGKEGIEAAYGAGEAGFNLAEQVGQRAAEGSQFKPYTVTSNLAQVQTDPRGGYNVNLSPQQQALQNQALGQAGQFFGQVGSYDPSIAAQRGAMGGLFGQSLGQYGQPTGLEGLTQAGISGAEGYLGSAGQPSDIEALRAQYAGLAGQAGQGLLVSPEQRQANIYESIRATQTPEEQRQRLALEERMLAQGRTGVSSDAYGGASPELLAMETARQEAMARAGLSARQQAMAEQQQGLATAQSLTGLTTGLAGTSSDLETAGIGRGTALANLGLAGTQASNTMGRQQLEDLLSLQRSDISSAQLQQALQQGRLGLGTGMLQAGYTPQNQALEMLRQSQVPAQYASAGRLQGADLQAQLGTAGVESLMQGSQLANELRQQQLAASLQSVLGAQSPTTGSFGGGLLEKLFGGSGGEYDWLPDWIGNPVYSDLEDETDEYDDYYDYDGGE